MKIRFSNQDISYEANLEKGHDLSIRLDQWPRQPNAFHAPPYDALPLRSGGFVGSIEAGSPVNFFNIRLNPHGNGTHTECAGHILDLPWSVTDSVYKAFCMARLISVFPEKLPNGDRCIRRETLEPFVENGIACEALIIRTLPNPEEKKIRNYSGTNPPYFDIGAVRFLRHLGIRHLLTDLPSIDREEDGGAVAGHHCFWETDKEVQKDKTITELIFVNNDIGDGVYLLNLQVLNIQLDASPSRPVLYDMKRI